MSEHNNAQLIRSVNKWMPLEKLSEQASLQDLQIHLLRLAETLGLGLAGQPLRTLWSERKQKCKLDAWVSAIYALVRSEPQGLLTEAINSEFVKRGLPLFLTSYTMHTKNQAGPSLQALHVSPNFCSKLALSLAYSRQDLCYLVYLPADCSLPISLA